MGVNHVHHRGSILSSTPPLAYPAVHRCSWCAHQSWCPCCRRAFAWQVAHEEERTRRRGREARSWRRALRSP
jgi:hypothetical protein